MWRGWSILAIIAAAFAGLPNARPVESEVEPAELEEVTVTGEATGSLTSMSPEESANQRTQVPGAFTVKTADEMELGERQTSKICCNERRAFSFNRKTAWSFPRFQFEGRVSHLKTSHSV